MKASTVATKVALQRAVQRTRKLEGGLRDLKREINELKARMAVAEAYLKDLRNA